jgi:polyphosphate kinase
MAGVQVDLVVRGFCCLRPGVPGLSESIRVSSTIGRFLEHSRIFWFGNGQADPLDGDFFIGSADWMYRNLNTRVECATPVERRAHRERLWQILQLHLTDRRQRWLMKPDGSYDTSDPMAVVEGDGASDPDFTGTHQRLMQITQELHARAKAARVEE